MTKERLLAAGRLLYYEPANNVTVVTGEGGGIVGARKGSPRTSVAVEPAA